ncbi:MAG: hypothetical protein OXG78_10900 [Chloroflexi bacterium]|nr:hypothetical protein [Chloroflexota bacterium]
MGYGRASSEEVLDAAVIEALAKKMGLDVSAQEAEMLTALLMNQLAAVESFNDFDLQDIVPAPIFRLDRVGSRRHRPADTDRRGRAS